MNKKRCFLTVMVTLVVMAGCGKKVDVALDTSAVNFAPEGESVEVVLTSNGDWVVDTYPEWLTVNPTSGNGNATLTLTAPLNDSEEVRGGELRVSTEDNSATLPLSQGAMEKDFIIVSPESIECEAEGGGFSLTVTSNCDWAAHATVDWVSCEPVSGNGNGTVTVTILPIENDIEFRETDIVFSGAGSNLLPIHVTQQVGEQIYINIDPSTTLMFDYVESAQEVSVYSNGSWIATPDADWVTLDITSGEGDAELTVTVSENEVMEARLAHVTFLSETGDSIQLTIKQEAAPDPHYLEVTPETVAFGKDGGTADITISCDVEWTASVEVAWVSLSMISGTGDGSITLTVEPNTVTEPRHANVTVVSNGLTQRVIVTQEAGEEPVEITVSADTLYAAYTGGFNSFSIFANTNWNLATSNDDWITLQTTSGTGDGLVNIIVDYNSSSVERIGVINVIHNISIMASIVVVQEGRPAIFETDITEIEAGPEGGQYTVHITANQSWNIETNADWVTCIPSSGNGNGEFLVKITPLTILQPRSAELRIYGSLGSHLVIPVIQTN